MKTVDVRHLQHHLGRYLDEVEHGEILEVRRRRNVIARIIPFDAEVPISPWPDLIQRLSEVYPDGPIEDSASQQLYKSRTRRARNCNCGSTSRIATYI